MAHKHLPYSFFQLIAVFLALLPRTVMAQAAGDTGRADLYIDCRGTRSASITLSLDDPPADLTALKKAVERSLHGTLHDVRTQESDGRWVLFARDDMLHPHGLMADGAVDRAPLNTWLLGRQCPWLCVTISHVQAPGSRLPPGEEKDLSEPGHSERFYVTPVVAVPSRDSGRWLTFSFGYTPADVARVLAPLLIPLVLPILLTAWACRRALRDSDTVAAWFGYARFSRNVATGMWLLWLTLIFVVHLNRFVEFLGGGRSETGLGLLSITGFIPPLLAQLACTALAYPVFARVRGAEWTRGDLVLQSFWNLARRLVPFGLLLTAVGAGIDSEYQHAVLWFIAVFVALQFCSLQYVRVARFTPQSITVGELRDRLFALAEHANVKVRQIYLLPAGKGRLANAFAMQNNSVLMTDYLIQNLSKREIDAIAAHEITHLKHNHPVRLQQILYIIVALPILMSFLYSAVYHWDVARALIFAPILAVVGQFTVYLISRRYERVADAGAVSLTGDPEAMITGLVKITQLNHFPVSWGKWVERTLTHPSTERRAEAIARQSGLTPERLRELIRSPDIDPDRYALPAGLDENQIYSTTIRGLAQMRFGWLQFGAIVLPPAIFASIGQHLALSGPLLWWLWLLGLTATIAAYLAVLNFCAGRGTGKLESVLRSRLESAGVSLSGQEAVFVRFSPTEALQLYDGVSHWDIGFIVLMPDRLAYLGEQARFALRRDQLGTVGLYGGWPGWLPSVDVRIAWRNEESGVEGAFLVRNGNAGSALQTAAAVRTLARRIEDWRKTDAPTGAASEAFAGLAAPAIGSVTGQPLAAVVKFSALFLTTLFLLLLASGVSLLFGLTFAPDQGGSALYVLGVAAFMAMFQWLPYVRAFRAADRPRGA